MALCRSCLLSKFNRARTEVQRTDVLRKERMFFLSLLLNLQISQGRDRHPRTDVQWKERMVLTRRCLFLKFYRARTNSYRTETIVGRKVFYSKQKIMPLFFILFRFCVHSDIFSIPFIPPLISNNLFF
jgi:hypothetical protein